MKSVLIAVTVLMLAVPDAGSDLFQEGAYKQARQAWQTAADDAGVDAPAGLHANIAMAALRAGELVAAEAAAEKAVAAGGEEFEAFRMFVQGATAGQRCLAAVKLTRRVEAGLPAYDSALSEARTASDRWQRAILIRPHWPEARRNLERVLRIIADVEKRRAEFLQRNRKESSPKPSNNNRNKQGAEEKTEAEQAVEAELSEMDARRLSTLLRRLREKQAKKKKERLARRMRPASAGGKDW